MAAEDRDPDAPTSLERNVPGDFVNAEVAFDALPGAETVDWMPLHPRFARRLQVGAAIRSVVYVAAAGAFQMAVSPRNRAAISESVPWLPAFLWTALGVFCVYSIVWPLIAVPHRGYVVREKDLLYKSGVLWRSVKAFPFNRVQHTKLHSNPLDRRFGLASLSVFPAGGGLGNHVRGLGQETAERLRVYISERIESAAGTAPAADPDEPPEAAGNTGR